MRLTDTQLVLLCDRAMRAPAIEILHVLRQYRTSDPKGRDAVADPVLGGLHYVYHLAA
jgi:hypothetical protein